MMRYPDLVRPQMCNTDIYVRLNQEGVSEDGAPIFCFEAGLTCNYQDSAKTVLTADKKVVQIAGIALFPGDICPELPAISGGKAKVHGAERTIFQGMKARNPDGTINYTELRLI